MRQHHHVDFPNAVKVKVGFNDPFTDIIFNSLPFLFVVITPLNTTINQHRSVIWKSDDCRVSLPDIKRDYFQQFSLLLEGGIPDPDRHNGQSNEARDFPLTIDRPPMCNT